MNSENSAREQQPFSLKTPRRIAACFAASLLNKKDRLLALTLYRMIGDRPRCFVNTIPKAGTHLIERCMALLPGMRPAGYHLRPGSGRDVGNSLRFLASIGHGCFVTAHLPFSGERLSLLEQMGYRHVLLIRDPRDIAVSLVFFLARPPMTRRFAKDTEKRRFFRQLPTFDERLTAAISGVPSIGLDGIGAKLSSFLPWADHGSLLVRFEDLVGEQGGGTRDRQIRTISRIAAHLGIGISESQASSIGSRIYSRRAGTFRKGEIGDWRNHFSDRHKSLFKEVAGKALIELGYESSMDW